MKACTKCGEAKPLSEFYVNRAMTSGRQSQCKVCMSAWMKKHYHEDPVLAMLTRAKARAKKKGLDFYITREDLEPLPTHCPVFGFKLRLRACRHDPRAYSLDRFDNSEGYVPGNVVVMSYLANRLKNNGTAERHEQIAAWMRKHTAETAVF